jgi:hypothetical protein
MPAKGARREKHVAGDKSQPDSLGTLLVLRSVKWSLVWRVLSAPPWYDCLKEQSDD